MFLRTSKGLLGINQTSWKWQYFKMATTTTGNRKRVTIAYDLEEEEEKVGETAPKRQRTREPKKTNQETEEEAKVKKQGDDDDEKTEVKKAIKGQWTADRRPPEWEKVWELVTEMRGQTEAPVDTEGCERLAERGAVSEKAFRFQTLVALMLSSQTKDTITAAAVRPPQAHCPTVSTP